MAITGRFEADFSSFNTAVSAAEVKLRSFETGSAKVESALSRMTDAFSGRKVIQDATLMAEAVERMGGSAKLTEAEFAKFGATASEAVAKLKALGLEVPANLQKVADAAKQVATATTQAAAATQNLGAQFAQANKLLSAFGVGISIAGVASFGREVLAAGDQIQKMADQTNLSLSAVQKLQFIAGQSGSSMDSLVGAVQNLQQRLGANDKGTVGAVAALNINLAAFKSLNAYEQMVTLAEAVRSIEDPTARAQMAADLFGKSWKEILPAILSGMRDVGEQAPLMADETVKALDRIGDQAQATKQQIIVWGGTLITAIENVANVAADTLSAFDPEHFGHTSSWLLQYAAEINDPSGLLRALDKVPPVAAQAAQSLNAIGLSASQVTEIERELTAQVKDSITAHEAEAAALKKVEEAQRAHTQSIQSLADESFGNKAIARATDWIEAVQRVENVSVMTAEAQRQMAIDLTSAISAMAIQGKVGDDLTNTMEQFRLAATAAGRDAAIAMEDAARRAAAAMAAVQAMEAAFKASGGTDIEGFRGGLVGTGQSPMRPFVGLAPSAFASGGVAGVNTPGTYPASTNVNVSGVLLSNNPSAREELRQFMTDVLGEGVTVEAEPLCYLFDS